MVRRFALLTLISALAGGLAALLSADKNKMPEPHALIAGSVFRTPGFALAGAEVTVTPAEGKRKEHRLQTDARGEFALRVPAVPMRYTVHVKKVGFQAQEKPAEVQGEGRVDLTFMLEPAQ